MTMNWSEQDSALYRQLSAIAVPARAEQLATLLTLIPFKPDEHFKVIELASGEGYLSAGILEAFPHAEVIALDYEASMQEATQIRLAPYEGRFKVADFDISTEDWFEQLDNADLVVSSLCIHHLDATGKKRLFEQIARRISSNGTLLIADLVLPQNEQARELFASTWDSMAESASIERTLTRDMFQLFVEEQWNYYRYPDAFDKPDPLYKQLSWLEQAGFIVVDVFWMQAGHAIYGAYHTKRKGGLQFENCLRIAHQTLKKA